MRDYPGCDRIAPLVERFGSEYPERRARDKMALKVRLGESVSHATESRPSPLQINHLFSATFGSMEARCVCVGYPT